MNVRLIILLGSFFLVSKDANSTDEHIEVIVEHARLKGYLEQLSYNICVEKNTPNIDSMLKEISKPIESIRNDYLVNYASKQGMNKAYNTWDELMRENADLTLEGFCNWSDSQAAKALRKM